MLQELSIRNFAIIDDLHIRFPEGLTILSGETGAGKSIIVNAVNLLLGSRATSKLIRTGAEEAELEALFQITTESKVAGIMKAHGYNPDEGLLIRRIISRKDRHSIYINGRLAGMQILSSITENLASISGQHAHQGLLKEEQQLLILDQFGGLMALREGVYQCFHEILPLIRKLVDLKTLQDRRNEQINLLEFQKKEILDASILPGEDANIEQEQKRLQHGEMLYQAVHDSIEELYSDQGAVIERLGEVKKKIEQVCPIDPALSTKSDAIAQAVIHLEDITEELRTYLNTIEIDEGRLEEVETRLYTLQRLKRKYGRSLEDVLSYLETINRDLSEIENISENILETESKIEDLHNRLSKMANRLSKKRNQAAKTLARKVIEELSTLGMAQTEFQISLQKNNANHGTDPNLLIDKSAVSETGIDCATFLIAPNVGESLKPLASIVSGGELSRIVLALKAILVETESVETIIFDEVDAGIGGSVAEVVGRKLSTLSRHCQTICITHLPQIAKFGNHQFRISKHVEQGRTRTVIEPLSEKERVKEIARMLGGAHITQATLDHAKEMLGA